MDGCAQAALAHSTRAAGKIDIACHKPAVLPMALELHGACRLVSLLRWRLPAHTTRPGPARPERLAFWRCKRCWRARLASLICSHCMCASRAPCEAGRAGKRARLQPNASRFLLPVKQPRQASGAHLQPDISRCGAGAAVEHGAAHYKVTERTNHAQPFRSSKAAAKCRPARTQPCPLAHAYSSAESQQQLTRSTAAYSAIFAARLACTCANSSAWRERQGKGTCCVARGRGHHASTTAQHGAHKSGQAESPQHQLSAARVQSQRATKAPGQHVCQREHPPA